jgi:phosphoglucosamine mutase
VTTPAVSFLVKNHACDGGAMVSASHNPYEYNGIKFFSREGQKLSDDAEDRIEVLMKRGKTDTLPADAIGRIERDADAIEHYVDHLTSTANRSFRGLTIVIDCAHGSASEISPRTFRRLGAEVFPIHNKPNGTNINVDSGSIHTESLQKAVLQYRADVGLAHDGDADRLIAVDETGRVLDGDFIMAICGLYMLRKGELAERTLVATVMSNLGLDIAFRKAGGRVIKTRVGDRYVLEQMKRDGYNLGGEQSGHIIFSGMAGTGDGILTGIQLLNVMRETGQSLSKLAKQMERLPQVLTSFSVGRLDKYEGNARIAVAIEESEEVLGDRGRIVVRPSGTEPLIRIMVEADKEELAKDIANRLAEVIKRELA